MRCDECGAQVQELPVPGKIALCEDCWTAEKEATAAQEVQLALPKEED